MRATARSSSRSSMITRPPSNALSNVAAKSFCTQRTAHCSRWSIPRGACRSKACSWDCCADTNHHLMKISSEGSRLIEGIAPMNEQNMLAAISAQYIAIGANTLPDVATSPDEYQDRLGEVLRKLDSDLA